MAKQPNSKHAGGRPRVYSDEDIGQVLFIMGDQAVSLKAASAQVGIDYTTVQKRIGESTELSNLYVRATEEYAKTQVEKLYRIAETVEDVQRARLMCDNIKWEAQRVCRKLYGDRTEITGKGGGPVEHSFTLTAAQVRRMAQEIVDSADVDGG